MKVFFHTITGRRDQNEDGHSLIMNYSGKHKKYNKINFIGIYDGHGGKNVSQYLEQNFPGYFFDKKTKFPMKPKQVKKIYNQFSQKLRTDLGTTAVNMGSTCLVLVMYRHNNTKYMTILNTGDCRAVVCKGEIAEPLTKDHKPNYPSESQRIAKLGGKVLFDGYDWRIKDLSVSRAFGDFSASPFVTHLPDMYNYKITSKMKFIIMACDGLWDVLSNQEATNFVIASAYNKNKKLKENINIAQLLVEYAYNKGSTDNISCYVIFL